MLTDVDFRQNNRGTEETPSDRYRICQCDFKVNFFTAGSQPGTTGYVSPRILKENKNKLTNKRHLRENSS